VRGYGQAIPRTVVKAEHYLISPAFEGDQIDPRTLDWCIRLCKENPPWRLFRAAAQALEGAVAFHQEIVAFHPASGSSHPLRGTLHPAPEAFHPRVEPPHLRVKPLHRLVEWFDPTRECSNPRVK
jgi:hypothetical protein